MICWLSSALFEKPAVFGVFNVFALWSQNINLSSLEKSAVLVGWISRIGKVGISAHFLFNFLYFGSSYPSPFC